MPGELAGQWPLARLSQIAELSLGKMLDKDKNRGEMRPYLANINVRWGSFDLHDLREMRFEEREFERYCLRSGDIVMCEGGEPGRCALWLGDETGMMIQKALHRIRPMDGIDSHYLYYALAQKVRLGAFAEYLTGGGIKHLPGEQLAKIEVPIPTLDEQRRIAEVLRSVDETVSTAQAVHDQSLTVKQRSVDALCYGMGDGTTIEPGTLPDDWQMVKLGEVLSEVRYGTSAKCDACPQEGLPVLRIPNVVRGRVDLNDLKFAGVSEADARRFSLQDGDIVLVRTNGNPAYIGRNALVLGVTSPLLFASYLIRLRCNHDAVSAAYIHAVFNSTHIRSSLLRSATTSAGNYNINTESLRALEVPLPPLPEQRRIAATVAGLAASCDMHEHDFRQKRHLRESLASDLLSGRVRVLA